MPKNIDILAFLEKVVLRNTKSFQEDFQIDKKILAKALLAQELEERIFLWMSRPCGTWCFKECSVLIRDSTEHSTWTHYEGEAEQIVAYRVTVTGQDNGILKGDVSSIDYKRQVLRVKENALPAETITLSFESGQTVTFQYEEVQNRFGRIKDQYGRILKIKYAPKDKQAFEALLSAERRQPKRPPRKKSAPSR